MNTFKAFRIFEEDGRVSGRVVDATLDELTPGEVVITAEYSSVNYKDALGATGSGKILSRFPLIGGIDVAGTVASSQDARFEPGDRVLVTGYELGTSHDGGFAQCVRVPADWVVPVPAGLSLFDAMALGTAGFTAALSIVRMEDNGLTPDAGPVIVTGATGGVGSLAVAMLSGAGYEVTALTGKDAEHDFLRGLGAGHILSRHTLDMGTRPLERGMWAGAVDAVGGDILAWLTRTVTIGGAIASSGLTAGIELHTTVMPFILRGISLLGVDSAHCPMARRRVVWERLAGPLKPATLSNLTRTVTLSELPDAFDTLLRGAARGRFVVSVTKP